MHAVQIVQIDYADGYNEMILVTNVFFEISGEQKKEK